MTQAILEEAFLRYHRPDFIADDPLQIPHRFTQLQDCEIMGFFAATLAWGQRKTIIKNCEKLIALFDNQPYQFILNHTETDLRRLENFKHRTFNSTDLLYFVAWLSDYYHTHESLEDAFADHLTAESPNVESALLGFHHTFFSLPYAPTRTKKHVATPARKSACKRLNMFLRWMVRKDDIDLGLWTKIKPSQLICPLDVHTERAARYLGLISRPKPDWLTAVELTENLQKFDAQDPVKYDFALFGLSLEKYTLKD